LVALVWVRRVSARLEALKQSYWDLRYDYTPEPEPAAPPSGATVSFVPLSTIRKKDR
jgi:hypothetical protein